MIAKIFGAGSDRQEMFYAHLKLPKISLYGGAGKKKVGHVSRKKFLHVEANLPPTPTSAALRRLPTHSYAHNRWY